MTLLEVMMKYWSLRRITADTFPDLSSTLTLFALCPLGEDVRKTGVLHRHLEAVGSVRLEVAENEVIQTHDLLVEGLGAAAEADLEAAGDVVHEVEVREAWGGDLGVGLLELELEDAGDDEADCAENSSKTHSLQRLLEEVALGEQGIDQPVEEGEQDQDQDGVHHLDLVGIDCPQDADVSIHPRRLKKENN